MFYRNISGLMFSDLSRDAIGMDKQQRQIIRLGLLSRFLITAAILAAPFVALLTVLILQGLSGLSK